MNTVFYPELHGRDVQDATITNDGSEALICSNGVKLFNCQKREIQQTITRFSNAVVSISHDQETMCVVSATAKGVVLVQYVRSNNTYQEMNRVKVRGFNTDGGKPLFSNNNQFLYFCTDSKKVWRYDCNDKICKCIYQIQYHGQFLNYDLFEDQLLITLNSSKSAEHKGFDILDKQGHKKKQFRYSDKQVEGLILRAKWIDSDKFIIVYPDNYSFYDCYQIVSQTDSEQLLFNNNNQQTSRSGKVLYDFYVSPTQKYVVFVLLDYSNDFMHEVDIYDKSLGKLIFQHSARMNMKLSFSQNDRYCFVCSKKSFLIDFQEK